jgi:hypothetical protein
MSKGSLSEYEPLVPCHKSLLEQRGYTKIKGKWVAPKKRDEELVTVVARPHAISNGNG